MKKIFIALITTMIVFLNFLVLVQANTNNMKLVVHYYRYDNNYEGFNFHLWEKAPKDMPGKDFEFFENDIDEFGAFREVNLSEENLTETTKFGIIIKKGGWEGYREPGGDRFFEVSKMQVKDNKIHAYFVEQDLNIGLSDDDILNNIPDKRPKILTTYFEKNLDVKINLTSIANKVEVLEDDILISTLIEENKNLTLKINKEIDLVKSYKVKAYFDDNVISVKDISIHNLYDTTIFEDNYTYDGKLGITYQENKTIFRLWAPLSSNVVLNLYNQGHPKYNNKGEKSEEITPYATYPLNKIEKGAWEIILDGNLANKYYTFSVTNQGITNEVTDPYSYSTGANGLRSMVVDFNNQNPIGWNYNDRPNNVVNLTDYIVYELQVRDLTTHSSWNGSEENRGKFLGFTEDNTTYTNKEGTTVTTGLAHLKELGINAVQLLPIFDFGYVDEAEMATNPLYTNTFNWGYMPYHFNTLEGSFSSNPFDGNKRINEFKQLVQTLHNNDIRVIMDVVYNHTGESENSNFHKIIPGYYHRLNSSGGFSNGSGTGNETASERSMVRNFMLDSIKFLATEYNLSGFRFDLMALHDVETMKQIEEMLYEIDPTIVIYGEPWDAGGAAIDSSNAAGKNNIKEFNNVGAFNDNTRDAIKGSVFEQKDGAWLQSAKPENHVENIKYGITGGVNHPQVNVDKWHLSPNRTINYVSAHDNNTLHDKLRLTGIKNDEKVAKMQIQANAMILTSQGIPFLHAGVDFMRSKPLESGGYDDNSYESPDSVNQLRWDKKASNVMVFEYYKALISIRKNYQQFRINNANDIINHLRFVDTKNPNIIHFEITLPNMPKVIVVHVGDVTIPYTFKFNDSNKYKVLTTYTDASVFGVDIVDNKSTILMNTSQIYIENKDIAKVKVKKQNVTIKENSNYDVLDNIKIDLDKYDVIYKSTFDSSKQGKYLINILVRDKEGNLLKLEYYLKVGKDYSDVKIKGEITV